MQWGEAIELVEDNVRHRFALDLDDDAVTVPVTFVAKIGNAIDLLLAHQFGNPLHQRSLVHLIWNFGDDEGFALLANGLDLDLAAHDDRAAAVLVAPTECRRGRG